MLKISSFIGKMLTGLPLDLLDSRPYSASGKRAVIVIDEQGVVRHRHDHLLGLDYQSADDLEAALDSLS